MTKAMDWFECGRIHGYGLTVSADGPGHYLSWIHFSERRCFDYRCEMSHCYCMKCTRDVDLYRMDKYE